MYDYAEIKRALVIAPKRVAEDTWSRESLKWDHLKHLKISKVLGPANKRKEALRTKADIYIINRENVEWLVDELGVEGWNFDMLVIDELSSFKSHQAKRFKALKRIRPLCKRVVGLTGTPAPNGYMDLWAEVYLLDRGERLGKTITHYRQNYFNAQLRPGYQIYDIREGARTLINNKIQDICLSMKAKDYLDMKEPLLVDVPVCLDPKEKLQYEQMERDAILEIAGEEITAVNAAAVTMKLLQMANGAVYSEDGKYAILHNKKLERLSELIEEANGNPVLVFYSFKHDLERIQKFLKAKHIKSRVLDTTEDISDWNNKQIPVLLAHPASAGHGLNLQDGGNIIVWFGLTWSLELYQQANARLHRQGQSQGVIIHHLIADSTVDSDVLKALQHKNDTQEALMQALKSKIARIKKELDG